MRGARADRHLAAHQARFPHVVTRNASDTVEPSAAEVARTHAGDTVEARIPIGVIDVHVGDVEVVKPAAIVAASPPGMEHFVGRQRHPADVTESEAYSEPSAAVT